MNNSATLLRDLKQQSVADLIKRGRSGSFVYAILWAVICFFNGIQYSHPEMLYGNLALLILSGSGRLALDSLTPEFVGRHHKICGRLFGVCALSQALHLGVLASYIYYQPEFQSLVFPILLVAAGAAGAGAASLAIDKLVRLLFPILMVGPFFISLTFHPSGPNFILACVCIIFIFYIDAATKNIYTDYWAAILNSALLSEQAIELKHLSTTDPLTQLHNRLHFNNHLDKEWQRAYRNQEPVTAMFIDLDFFKLINDKFGHDAGDICLQQSAALLKKYAQRAGDALARYGGEEFVVFFSDTQAGDGEKIAEKIINEFRSLKVQTPHGEIELRCSIGICSYVPNGSTKQTDLLIHADKALYEAKRNGRDCYRVFESGAKPLHPFQIVTNQVQN